MKKYNIQSKIVALALLLFSAVSMVNAQTRIDATVLLKAGGNNTQLYTNGSGAVVWGNAASYLTEGVAIDITGNTIDVDITELDDLGATPDGADFLLMYDFSASQHKRVAYGSLLAGVAHIISDGTNTQTIENGQTLLFASTSSDGYDFTVSSSDQVSFSYDFPELSALATIDAAADKILIYDASASNYKTITTSQLTSSSSFLIWDGTNTQVINANDTLRFDESVARGIDVVVSATDKVAIDLDINELTTDASPDFAADFIPTYDVSATTEKKVLLSNLVPAPSDNNVSIVSNTPANTDIASGLTLSAFRKVFVYLDGVRQRQTTDWAINGNNIQFTFDTNAGQVLGVVGFR